MSALNFLVRATASVSAGRALLHSVHALIAAGHRDAAALLTEQFVSIRDGAEDEAVKDVQVYVPGAEQDVIHGRTT